MITIRYARKYRKNLQDLLIHTPTIGVQVEQCIRWFKNRPSDTRLRNHALHKKLSGKWAFSVTDDIRIVYEWVGTNTVRFLVIGGHTTVYRSTVKG